MTIEQYIKENLDLVKRNEASQYSQNFLIRFAKVLFFPVIGFQNIVRGMIRDLPKFESFKKILLFIIGFAWIVFIFYFTGQAFIAYFKGFIALPQSPLTSIFSIYIGFLFLGIIFSWEDYHGLRKKIMKKYFQEQKNHVYFDEKMISQAADVLRKFKRTTYDEAVSRHGEIPIDLLIITNSIGKFSKTNQLGKIISLKALAEDREATAKDDEEEGKAEIL